MIYPTPNSYKKQINPTNRDRYYAFYDPEHPLAGKKDGMVYLHRHIASLKIGRWLNRKEHVHPLKKLKVDIKNMSMVNVGKKYGVSDNTVRKWLKHGDIV